MYIFLAHILHGNRASMNLRIKMCKNGDMMYTSMAHIFFTGFCGVSGRKDTFICSSFIDRYGTPYGVLNYYDSKIKYYHPPVSYF